MKADRKVTGDLIRAMTAEYQRALDWLATLPRWSPPARDYKRGRE